MNGLILGVVAGFGLFWLLSHLQILPYLTGVLMGIADLAAFILFLWMASLAPTLGNTTGAMVAGLTFSGLLAFNSWLRE